MKIYDVIGYSILIAYAFLCAAFAPPHLGPGAGLLIGAGYLVLFWFLCGVYLSNVMHLGIAHRALDYKPWFIKTVMVANNTFGVYVNPTKWVSRHRLHHKFSDHEGDPNKLGGDGFWRTMYLCLFPYRCRENMATDDILQSWPFRLVANPIYAVFSQLFNFCLLWWLVRDLRFALTLWFGFRVFALWVNMVQNYWTHDRRFGYRRYDDDDNAMNIGEWLPVTITFSACFQNNHHHFSSFLRLSHDPSEYDFGYMTVKGMKRLGLVEATRQGKVLPPGAPLKALDF